MTTNTQNITPPTQRATANALETALSELDRAVATGRCSVSFALTQAAIAGAQYAVRVTVPPPADLREAIRSWNRGECLGLGVRGQLTEAGLLRYTGASWVPTEEGAKRGLTLEGLGKTLGAHRGLSSASDAENGGAQ